MLRLMLSALILITCVCLSAQLLNSPESVARDNQTGYLYISNAASLRQGLYILKLTHCNTTSALKLMKLD